MFQSVASSACREALCSCERLAGADHLRQTPDVGGNHGHFARHGFQRRQAEGLQLAGQKEQVADAELFIDGILFPQETDVLVEAFFPHQILDIGALRAVADEQ